MYVGEFFRYVGFFQCMKSVTNILSRSPTFQTCHQHIWSPTSVTNIDVTIHELREHDRCLKSEVKMIPLMHKFQPLKA